MKQTAADIDRIAADWVVREDRQALTPREQAERDAWLAQDPRRQGAYVRAQAAWSMMDRGRAMASDAPPRRWPLATRRELMAASLVGVAGLGGFLAVRTLGQERYATARGEIRRVPLADGSSAAINTASRIEVDLTPDRRTVTLTDGEAWFDVARDGERRPFLVQASEVRVRAQAGAFSVRRMAKGAEIIVANGVVECWTTADPTRVLRLPAGAKMLISNTAVSTPDVLPPTTVGRLLAWREGMVGLDGETLAEAAAEFNRYNDRQIVIEDAALGQERLVGYFRANDPESFVRAAAGTLGAEVAIDQRQLRLSLPARS